MPRLKNASLCTSSETCTASTRVGQRMSTCTARNCGSVFSMAGMANAAVLPEPVCDWPTTSRPAIRKGMASAWIGAAFSKPSLSTALSNPSDRPSSENSFGVMQCVRDWPIITEICRRNETSSGGSAAQAGRGTSRQAMLDPDIVLGPTRRRAHGRGQRGHRPSWPVSTGGSARPGGGQQRYGVGPDHVRVEAGARLGDTALGAEVHEDDPEPLLVTPAPFEVVHQRPDEVPS